MNKLYCGDCKSVMEQMIKKRQKVDLIYLDPPFNSNRIYNFVFRGRGAGQQKAFDDMWSYTKQTHQMALKFYNDLDRADISSLVKNFLMAWIKPIIEEGTRKEKSLVAYLIYMTERLILMKQLLKDSGSIYYHCDTTASHYIKIIMDGVFGRDNFRNEIIWHYGKWSNACNHFQKNHDVIFLYSKSKEYIFNPIYIDKRNQKAYHTNVVKDQGQLLIYDVKKVPTTIRRRYQEKGYKEVIVEKEGVLEHDVWTYIREGGINIINSQSKERLGYPTQKPIALLDKIIKTSTKKGSIVLDPFCGCGTACEAAEHLGRKWIGIDLNYNAIKEVKNRLEQIGIKENEKYEEIMTKPKDRLAYDKLDPYQKQDFLIEKLHGSSNKRKSGDGGIDGKLTIHLGKDKKGNNKWGNVIFSVKTGNQANPAHLRELKGLLDGDNVMGCLILERDPTGAMEDFALKAGEIEYYKASDLPPDIYDTIQILTVDDILVGDAQLNRPPSLQEVNQAQITRGQKNLL